MRSARFRRWRPARAGPHFELPIAGGRMVETREQLGNSTALPAAERLPEMMLIPGGTFRMGSADHYPEERPVHRVTVDRFWIDRVPVTNREFRRFVEATGHVTLAERAPDPAQYPGAKPEMLHPGSLVFVKPPQPVDMRDFHNWWTFRFGADWRHPRGPNSTIH